MGRVLDRLAASGWSSLGCYTAGPVPRPGPTNPSSDRANGVGKHPKCKRIPTDATTRRVRVPKRLVLLGYVQEPEAQVVLVGQKVARMGNAIRPRLRSGNLLERMQLLLLGFALANAAGAFGLVLATASNEPFSHALGLAAPVVIAGTWILVYRRGRFPLYADALVPACSLVVAANLDVRWQADILVFLTSAVLFAAAYSDWRGMVVRTALLSYLVLEHGITENPRDPSALPNAIICVFIFCLGATFVLVTTRTLRRYERASRSGQILSAMGLELVTASDMKAIAAAGLEAALALCPDQRSTRVTMAVVRDERDPGVGYDVVASRGCRSIGLEGALVKTDRPMPSFVEAMEQFVVESSDAWHLTLPSASPEPALDRKLAGRAHMTGITVSGVPRALLVIESPERLGEETLRSIRSLSTQLSLAIARVDLQRDAIEQQSAARFQALIQSSSDVISIVAPDGRVRYQSPSAFEVFGFEPEAIVGTDFCNLVHPEDADRVREDFQRATNAGDYAVTECRIRHAEGDWRYTEMRMTNLVSVEAIGGVVINARDVTQRHALEAELRHQAFHDSLTGLANRSLFINMIEHTLTTARRDGSWTGVLLCDLEGFKRINDSLGLGAGDSALVMIAERLRGCVRGQDTVARLAGNEFGVLLERLSTPADATLAMERIMSVLRQPLSLPGAQVELQPHVGVAVAQAGDGNADEMLRNGAVAMHQARIYEGGYAIFDPEMHADAIRRIEMESLLRTAIEERQFVLHYQPLIDLQSGHLTGVEALVRWQHPTRGLVPPMEFIPLAEETGLIVPLGQWAILEACNQVRLWQKEIPADEPIALNVNLSARQLRHPNIVRDIADALDDSGLLPGRLILEITESVLMIDTAATLSRLFQLKSLGVRLAVDDFGTGYSSFAYLRRFPVDILKIDKSFVDGVATEPTASALVDAMIRIGKTLRLETVAEGVEKPDQAERLRSLQCDLAQGYLYSKPMPSEMLTKMLSDRANGSLGDAARADAA